ncbi:MAG: AbrB/MazE/SpoVT family DNA-binding domain-containing protein [Methylococcaceae bacterium]
MTQVAIRQSGGANIISIPKVILRTLALDVGASLDLSVEDNKIILTPVKESLTLEVILEGSPKSALRLTEEDLLWLNNPSVGKEI